MDAEQAEMTMKDKITATISSLTAEERKKPPPPLFSLQLLKEYGDLMRFNQGEKLNERRSTPSSSSGSRVLSTNDIMRMASSRIMQCKTQNLDVVSILINDSFDANSGMSSETNEDLKLAVLLHACALKVYNQEFGCARKLLTICKNVNSRPFSISGNQVQKVVSYLSEALEKRITREIRIGHIENPEGDQMKLAMQMEEALTNFHPAIAECEQKLPFCRICQYTAIQSIQENVASARRIHLIDLGIRSGSHWTILMHGLQTLADRSECPLEMLKLTAIGTSKETIAIIGNHLSSFAESMKIPFQFKPLVLDLKNLRLDMFEIEADEAIVVYSQMRLASLLVSPGHLESVLQTIADLHPCVMVSTEIEADTNASDFMERFNEIVSVVSTVFDCLEDGLDKQSPFKAMIEEELIREGIQNTIIAEGEDRVSRYHRIGVWRTFMVRFGLVERQLSSFALNLAKMLVYNNPRWRACTLESDGKSLIVGWRGSPIKSISVWKYQNG